MKALTEYTSYGYDFKLVRRLGRFAVFVGTKPGCANLNYEVMQIQQHKETKILGKTVVAAEHPPSNSQWGVKGWTYTNLVDAVRKFEELTRPVQPV